MHVARLGTYHVLGRLTVCLLHGRPLNTRHIQNPPSSFMLGGELTAVLMGTRGMQRRKGMETVLCNVDTRVPVVTSDMRFITKFISSLTLVGPSVIQQW